MTRKIGQIIGLFSSVAIVLSVFVSYVGAGFGGYSLFSMNLIKINPKGAIVIAGLGLLAFVTTYSMRGFITSLLSLAIFIGNLFFFATMTTGDKSLDDSIKMMNYLFGNVFQPGVGFYVAFLGSVMLFFSGILIKNGNDKMKNKKETSTPLKY